MVTDLTDGQGVRALLRPSILVPRTTEGRPPNLGIGLPTRVGVAGFDSLWKLPRQGLWPCLWLLFVLMVGMLSGPLAVAGWLGAAALVRWWG